MLNYLVYSLIIVNSLCHSAKILAIYPLPFYSHHKVFAAVTRALAENGHQLDVVTTNTLVSMGYEKHVNVTEIDISELTLKIVNEINHAGVGFASPDPVDTMAFYQDFFVKIANEQFSSIPFFKRLSACGNKYDLMIGEFATPIYFAIAGKCGIPSVSVNTCVGFKYTIDAFGGVTHPLYYIDVLSKHHHTEQLTYGEKYSTLRSSVKQTAIMNDFYKKYDDVIHKHFGGDVKPIKEIVNNVDLNLMQYNTLLSGPRPSVPAIVYFDSLTLLDKQEVLNESVAQWMDDALSGVVYFSLGTLVSPGALPPRFVGTLIDAIEALPYRVICKWPGNMTSRSGNVLYAEWFDQKAILRHRNTRAFVTHGGPHSIDEAVHSGVPMVSIPFIGDQIINTKRLVHLGIGRTVEVNTLTRDNFIEAIIDVVENKKYKENIIKLSTLSQDQPSKALSRIVWWVEYVIRRGGRGIRSPAADSDSTELYLMDVILLVLSFFASILVGLVWILSKIL